jgi:hypothetical protein
MNENHDPFTVFSYTDAQALEDGVLVDVSPLSISFAGKPVNRVTASVWYTLETAYCDNEQIAAVLVEVLRDAKPAEDNCGDEGDMWISYLDGNKVWIMHNEVGGMTIMYPEDY